MAHGKQTLVFPKGTMQWYILCFMLRSSSTLWSCLSNTHFSFFLNTEINAYFLCKEDVCVKICLCGFTCPALFSSPSMMTSLVTLSWDSTRGACSSPRRVLERRGRASVLGWTIRGSWRFLRCFCSSSALCGPNGRKEMAWKLSLCINEFHCTWLENHCIYQASIKYYKRLRRFSQARKHPLYKLRVITLVCMMSYNLCKWPGA